MIAQQAKRPHIEEDRLGVNPFLSTLVVPVNKIIMSGQYRADKEGLILPVEVELDKDVSCKVFVDAGRRKQMVALTPRAKDLLLWLIYEVDSGRDWMWINYLRYMAECDVRSYNTYKTAVRELCIKNFLGTTVLNHVYWINPHFFFNGSRIAAFPGNVVRK